MLKIILYGVCLSILVSCSQGFLGGNNKQNLAELDKLYGKCDNPFRQFTKAQKKICKDKERAAGPDGEIGEPINITEIIENYRSGGKTVYANNSVNTHLWNASLIVVDPYNIKLADSQGGVISTEWIMEKNTPNRRCSIKINITTKELLSNGVRTKFICEQKELQDWYLDNQDYTNQERNMTLKILEIANRLNTEEKISK